jgi:hypothetical protein
MNYLVNNRETNETNETNETDDYDTESTFSENTNFSDYMEDENDYSYNYNSNFQINLSNNCVNKNVLLIPELYNKYFHGKTMDSDPNIDSQFLVLQTFYINSNNNMFEFFKYVNNLVKFYKKYYEKKICELYLPHVLLRNYNKIIRHPKYLNLEIGNIYYLKGNECVCVIKTVWFKIVQRAWKKIYKIRMRVQQLRCRPDSIMYRQVTGKWPENCNYMPSLRGMFYNFVKIV